MTLIECFDKTVLENIAGTLYLNPDKVIFLGEAEKMQGVQKRFQDFLDARGMNVQVVMQDIQNMNINALTKLLLKLVSAEPDCVIDVTGGDERVLVAVGMMLGQVEGEKPTVQKFDLATDHPMDCDGDGMIIPPDPVRLTVKELVALHGGIVHPDSYQPSQSATALDIAGFWKFVAEDPYMWNDLQTILGQFEKRSEDKYEVTIPKAKVKSEIKDYRSKEKVFQNLLNILETRGMIRDFSDEKCYRYRYNSGLFRQCTKKAGNALELKVLLEARAQKAADQPYFHDCMMGVHIDWDGIVHVRNETPDTRNEIDLILTRGLSSLFVSCKNGTVEEEELYKLHTVAQQFGGPYAKKLLIATDLSFQNERSERAFHQRARDMQIHIEPDAGSLTSHGWRKLFLDLMEE